MRLQWSRINRLGLVVPPVFIPPAFAESNPLSTMPNATYLPRALLLLLVGFLLIDAPALAQEAVQYPLHSDSSKVWVDGTSNKSPTWTMHATVLEGSVTMSPTATAAEPGVEAVELKVMSQKLKSKKSSIMDRLAYDALKVKQHEYISYSLTSVESVTATDDKTFTMETLGNLTLAGETKEIAMTVEGKMQDDGTVTFTGSHTMLMSDYKIKPPTAMFGALHTGDEVVVHAELVAGPMTGATGSQ